MSTDTSSSKEKNEEETTTTTTTTPLLSSPSRKPSPPPESAKSELTSSQTQTQPQPQPQPDPQSQPPPPPPPLKQHKDENASVTSSKNGGKNRNARLKEKLSKTKKDLEIEKQMKQKLYKGLVKLASELKDSQTEIKDLKKQKEMDERTWYDGGMWRAPELLPGIQDSARQRRLTGQRSVGSFCPRKNAVSLSDLFFDLIIVTAFTRVGVAIQDRGCLDWAALAYFCIFWLIWGKEASFSTRFDTTDLSCQIVTLLTCFAVLFGSLSSTAQFDSEDATRMMIVAAFVALLHFCLHLRVWFWFKDVSPFSEMVSVKDYALYIMFLTAMEFVTWCIGIFVLEESSPWRGYIFLIAILMSFRLPKTFLPNDFHAACSKRGVLFILLLGFILQNIVLVASPFFGYQMPTSEQYCFLALVCFLLFCIKLLYVDDSFSVDPSDHALLVSRTAGFFFHLGQLSLLLSTTILGSGLNLLTHSYLAATSALPDNAKTLVCGGFASVVMSIGVIKSMHLRRVPLNPVHRQLFYAAYGTQVAVLAAVVYTTVSMSLNRFVGEVMMNELEMLSVLCCLALFLLAISWLDEGVELKLYGDGDAKEFRVHPFGLWTCLKPGNTAPPLISDARRLSHLSPMLKDSKTNLFDSQINIPIYNSIRSSQSQEEASERKRLVKFSDDVEENGFDDEVDVVV